MYRRNFSVRTTSDARGNIKPTQNTVVKKNLGLNEILTQTTYINMCRNIYVTNMCSEIYLIFAECRENRNKQKSPFYLHQLYNYFLT